jgi:hypothetical protein
MLENFFSHKQSLVSVWHDGIAHDQGLFPVILDLSPYVQKWSSLSDSCPLRTARTRAALDVELQSHGYMVTLKPCHA